MKDEVKKVPPGHFSHPFSDERDPIDVILNGTCCPSASAMPLVLKNVLHS